jgi:enoyl-CoA hydratase/carnithine racemase
LRAPIRISSWRITILRALVNPPAEVGPTGYRPWTDFVLRLGRAPVVSIAKVAGRARGVGNEFVLACDLRFASKEKAVFGQPEVGVGLIPGGGASEWLPRLVGRSRAIEIILSADDFDATAAEAYGMINRAIRTPSLTRMLNRSPRELRLSTNRLSGRLRVSSTGLEFRRATTSRPAIAPSLRRRLGRERKRVELKWASSVTVNVPSLN